VSDKADVVITVSKIEADEFLKRGIKNVNILAHSVNNKLSNNSFSCRKNILFVGVICESPSPNEDAILYFCSHILPIILQKIDLQLCIVGTNKSNAVWRLASPKISVIGRVEDLSTYFNSFKIFIAPSRYAAGIPLKVCEAASYGIPCVITPLLAKQLEWSNGAEALVGKNATHFAQQCIRLYSHEKLWHSIRENAYGIVSKEYSSFVFEKRVSRICAAGQVHLQRKY
jgi:O-antigen biosynthesis protein